MLTYHDIDRTQDIAIGDIARLPFRLRDGSIDTTTWEVVAFGTGDLRHCVIAQRRCDGHIQHLALHHWRRAVDDADVRERSPADAVARHHRRSTVGR